MATPKTAKIICAVLILAGGIGSALYLNRHEASASTQSTNDAYVQADFTTVAPQVSGVIDRVLVDDNQFVRQGELLAFIDDRDFIVAEDAAKAQVASAQASIAELEARLVQQQTAIRQAQAAVISNEAELKLAENNEVRYRRLARDGLASIQTLQLAETQLGIQLANREKNQAGLQAARQQVDILEANLEQAKALLAQAQATQASTELRLSHTRITAPISGTVGHKSLRTGAFVSAGSPLLVIVPLDAVYITANFRETQLARMRAGQAVDIQIDALPDVVLKGTLESLGPATGVSYSTIAPHNATGNFTKIVQRLPVRIRLNEGQQEAKSLRVGMSVTPQVHVDASLHFASDTACVSCEGQVVSGSITSSK